VSAVKAIRALQLACAPVAAIVGTRIYAGEAPEDAGYPYLFIHEVDRNERSTTSLAGNYVLVTARVQVTPIARSYGECKALLQAAKLDAGAHTGVIAGVTVRSVTRGAVGPDFHDAETDTYEQSRDFTIVFTEAN
jgi:hypothetical protein